MSKLERVDLFDFKSGLFFTFFLLLIASLSLSYEYHQFTQLKTFDDPLVRAEVIAQEVKLIADVPKTSIKLRLENGSTVRTALSPNLKDLRGRKISIELYIKHLTFLEYLKGFHARAVLIEVYPERSIKEQGYSHIASMHEDGWMQELYGALFVATPMSQDLQTLVGAMGLSHILSISGYHYGIISLVIYFLLRPPYRWLHNRYFPYRHFNRDLFFIVLAILFAYLWALEFIAPMVRAFGMIVVGYWLYDRGIKVVSLQSLFITVGVLLAFFPKLFFALGFWFSSFGVLSIFIFIRYYEHWRPWQIFLALHIWCYLVLLPISLAVFGTFSWWHIASIPLALVFNLYYPVITLSHLVGFGDWCDPYLIALFESGEIKRVVIPMVVGVASVALSLLAMRYRWAFRALGVVGLGTLGAAVYQIA